MPFLLPKIGPYQLNSPLLLAPMAGITDRPFRNLCRQFGAGLTFSEMVTSDMSLWHSRKSKSRLPHQEDPAPRAIQITGTDPEQMAIAAKTNEGLGAELIDINMGCPAKKVCNKAAGSALMKDEKLIAQILEAIINAVSIPVTLKMRTGWDKNHKNALSIAKIAESSGVKAITIHGRTREDLYKGSAEYDTIAEVKICTHIPIFANGDINTPEKAKYVLHYTGVDGLMIGRASQGNPWIFKEIVTFLATGVKIPPPSLLEKRTIIFQHLKELHNLYGQMGTKIARKHISWYLAHLPEGELLKPHFNQLQSEQQQIEILEDYFAYLTNETTGFL